MKKLTFLIVTFLVGAMFLPACAPSGPDCASEEVFCVGLVTEVGKISDKSVNQSAWEGVQRAGDELGAHIEHIETTDAKDHSENISNFGDQEFDVIVTVGSGLGEATAAAAAVYPETHFIGVEQVQEQVVNGVVSLSFHEDQAGFLVGALAAMISKSGQIGAVCGSSEVPSVWRIGEGYRAGAAYADQFKGTETQVVVHYHRDNDQAFTDPAWGEATAQTMLEGGTDVIFGCGGLTGNAAILTSAQAGAYAIGMDADQYLTIPEVAPRMLTSAMKHIAPEVFKLIRLSEEGNFLSGNYIGETGYAPYHDLEDDVPPAVKALLEQIQAGLRDGSIKTNVPVGSR